MQGSGLAHRKCANLGEIDLPLLKETLLLLHLKQDIILIIS